MNFVFSASVEEVIAETEIKDAQPYSNNSCL
jgi:hypothetical protein